ncbi:MAG: ABC transporter permease [Chloroflexi bacterium]|nr:ABC transporter permease [Chloroflexota bacterium]
MEIATTRGNINNAVIDTFLSFRFELVRYLKSKRLLILGGLAIIMPLLFLLKTVNTASGFAVLALDVFGVFIVISAAMFTGDAVNGEFERKTNLLSFSTPQRRSSIFIGKYIAAVLATFFVIMLFYLTMTLQMAGLYGWGEIPAELGKSFLIALLSAAAAVGVVFFFSSLLKRTMASTIVGALFIMWVMEIVRIIMMVVGQEPWFIPTYSAELLKNVLNTESILDLAPQQMFQERIQERFGITLTFYEPELWLGIAVLATWAIVGFVSGMAIAVRRED